MALKPFSSRHPPPEPTANRRPQAALGQALRALPGEQVCGDQLGWWTAPNRLRLALTDGLGHGREAHAAAVAAIDQLSATVRRGLGLPESFADCDRALLGSRGTALAVVDILFDKGEIEHAAVGNIRTILTQNGRVKRLGGTRGIVGAGFASLRPERLSIAAGDWLIMFSDGIRENADITAHLKESEPSDQLARTLIDQWADDRDDAGLLLYRHD